MNFGVTSVAAPNAASSSTAMYSSTARLDTSGDKPSDPWNAALTVAARARSEVSSFVKFLPSWMLCENNVLADAHGSCTSFGSPPYPLC